MSSDGSVNVAGTISSAGAADTVGASVAFNANSVCATVLLAGQVGAGFFLGAGTSVATYTPALSEDATPAAPGCTGGNWTASAFVDTSGNASAAFSTTNPNAFQQYGIKTLAGSRCARVCTTAFTGGSATGLLIATTVPSPAAAAGADVTDRAGRALGVVASITAPVAVTASALPLPTGAATEAGHLATIDTSAARIPAQGQALAAGSLPVVLTAAQQAALTPPAAIAGYALEAGHLAAIDTSTAKIPAQGQALAGASMPVVLPAAQVTTLTPPAAITGYALDATLTGGTTKAISRGGAKGATTAADLTSTAEGADHQALDVQLWLSGSALDPRTRSWTLSSGTDSVAVSGTVTATLSGSIGNTAFAQTATAVSPATDTGTCTSVSTNTTVEASSSSRHVLLLVAPAANTDLVYVKLGATATSSQPPLSPGQSLTLDSTAFPYTGQVDALAASGTQKICTLQW